MTRGIHYSTIEDDIVRAGFAAGKNDREIASELTDRTWKSVQARRCALRLLHEEHVPNRTGAPPDIGCNYWTDQALASEKFACALRRCHPERNPLFGGGA